MLRSSLAILAILTFGLCDSALAAGGENLPDPKARPVSSVAAELENSYDSISRLKYKKNTWRAWVVKGTEGKKLTINPKDIEVTKSKDEKIKGKLPPEDALALSKILRSLEKQAYRIMPEIEYTKKGWNIKVYQGKQWARLNVDAKTGKILDQKFSKKGKF